MATATGALTRETRSWARLIKRPSPFVVFSALVGSALAALSIYPLSRVLLRLFYNDGELDLSGLTSLSSQPGTVALLVRTLTVVVVSGSIALVVGATMAWINERTDARLGFVTDSLPLVPFMLPPIAGAIGWVLLLSPRAGYLNVFFRSVLDRIGIDVGRDGPLDIFTWYGLILVYVLYMVPYVFVMMSAAMRNIDGSLEEQSRVCGAGLWRTVRRVTVPTVRPSVAGAVLLLAWFGFALFSVPVIIGTRAGIEVLSVRIVNLIRFTYPAETDAAVGLSLVVVLFVGITWLATRRLMRSTNFSVVGGKGHREVRFRLGFWRWPARMVLIGYVFVAAVLPLGALVLVSLSGFWTPDIDWGGLSLSSFRRSIFDDVATYGALSNSVKLGLVGATIAIVLAAIVAEYNRRSRGRLAPILDGAIKLPATLSNIVLAVGFILAFAGPPFNLHGTLLILLLAYIVLYMPQGSVAADAAASQVGKELVEASQVATASPGRTFLRINLPLMLPGLIAGWALMFVRFTGDLNASALLSGTDNRVVGSQILQVFQTGSFANLASLALALTLVSTTIVIIMLSISRIVSRRWGADAGRTVPTHASG